MRYTYGNCYGWGGGGWNGAGTGMKIHVKYTPFHSVIHMYVEYVHMYFHMKVWQIMTTCL